MLKAIHSYIKSFFPSVSKVNEAYDRLRTGKVIGRIVLKP